MNKKHLIERFLISKNCIEKIPLTESNKILEKDGKKLNCRAAYEIPVWRLGEKNLNERIYGKNLAEKLIKEKAVTLGLANHPKEDADVTKTFAVEKNPHIKENIMFVDAYLVGPHGDLAKEIIEAGGSIGLSSSAYGDVDDDGNIIEDDFEIERYADWVDMPSYQVFAGKENEIVEENISESIEEKEILNKDKFEILNTNIKRNKNKENFNMEKGLNKIEEKNLKMGVRNLFKEAENKSDLKEKIQVYQEVIEYCDGVESADSYVKEANENIKKLEKEIYELADKGQKLDKLKEDSEKTKSELTEEVNKLKENLNTLTEEYDVACKLLDDMKQREKKLKELYEVAVAEKNGMIEASEYKELHAFATQKEKEIEELQESILKLKEKTQFYRKKAAGNLDESNDESQEDKKKKKKNSDDDKDEEDEDNKQNTDSNEYDEDFKLDFRNDKKVEQYYNDLYENNPEVKKIKQDIMKCKTVYEAQMTYMRLKDLIYDIPDPKKKFRMSEIEAREGKSSNRRDSLSIRKGWL